MKRYSLHVLLLLWVGFGLLPARAAAAPAPQTLLATCDSLRVRFAGMGIEFRAGPFTPSAYARQYATWAELSPADEAAMVSVSEVFSSEWGKYPPEWIRAVGLKAVVFVKKLVVMQQARSAMPDAGGMTLYLDIDYFATNERYMREVIHHEFYHLIDHSLNGSLTFRDPVWESFNPPYFSYGNGGAAAYSDPNYNANRHPRPGFANTYATYAEEEDRAELYAALWASHLYPQLQNWVAEDEYLRAKLDYMLAFFQKYVPEMDARFFAQLHQNDLPELPDESEGGTADNSLETIPAQEFSRTIDKE